LLENKKNEKKFMMFKKKYYFCAGKRKNFSGRDSFYSFFGSEI
jgi:hypothetical protein